MKILLVAATEAEIATTISHLGTIAAPVHSIEVCITGVGLTAATFALTRRLSMESYDLVLQAGIAGSFGKHRGLGEIVVVANEQLGDLGAEDGEQFLDIFSLGFGDRDAAPFKGGLLVNEFSSVPFAIHDMEKVKGLTINTVSGREATIAERVHKYGPDIESMEGAALHFVCLQLGVPFLQVRAISNYVTWRDRSAWKIGPAVAALNKLLIQWLAP